jgi:hypothetical protein
MESHPDSAPRRYTDIAPKANRPPQCPICGGVLILLRSFWRCPRCQYRICEECDGAGDYGSNA